MIDIEICNAKAIRKGLVRVEVAVFDEDDILAGEYEIAIPVLPSDTIDTIGERIAFAIRDMQDTYEIASKLIGHTAKVNTEDIEQVVMPGYNKAEGE